MPAACVGLPPLGVRGGRGSGWGLCGLDEKLCGLPHSDKEKVGDRVRPPAEGDHVRPEHPPFLRLNLKMAETLSEYSTKINTFYVTDIIQGAIFAPKLLRFIFD